MTLEDSKCDEVVVFDMPLSSHLFGASVSTCAASILATLVLSLVAQAMRLPCTSSLPLVIEKLPV